MRPRLVGRIAPLHASGAVDHLAAADMDTGVLHPAVAALEHTADHIGHFPDLAALYPVSRRVVLRCCAAALNRDTHLRQAPVGKAPAVKGQLPLPFTAVAGGLFAAQHGARLKDGALVAGVISRVLAANGGRAFPPPHAEYIGVAKLGFRGLDDFQRLFVHILSPYA